MKRGKTILATIGLVALASSASAGQPSIEVQLDTIWASSVGLCKAPYIQSQRTCIELAQEANQGLRLTVYTNPNPKALTESYNFCLDNDLMTEQTQLTPDAGAYFWVSCTRAVYPEFNQ